MAPVTILLSTHNGSRFIGDQLTSFTRQNDEDWALRWRDDASGDDTRRLLAEFDRGAARGRSAPLADDGRHLGIMGSFLALLRARLAERPGGLIAFSDQDDVWLPEKLTRGEAALASVDPDRPALYCARQMLVDRRLRTLALSPELRRPPGFPAALTQNIATGCTVMLNAAAARLIASVAAPSRSLHDWWAYLLVAASGGTILFDDVPVVLYRQHPGNAVGAARSPLRRGAGALRRGPGGFMSLLRSHVGALKEASPLLSAPARAVLCELESALAGSAARRLRTLRRLDLGRQTFGETVLFDCWFLLG